MKGPTLTASCTRFVILGFFPTHDFTQTSAIPFLFMLSHMPKLPLFPCLLDQMLLAHEMQGAVEIF
jgi:hypothetical protein